MSASHKIVCCMLLLAALTACNRRPEGVLSRSAMRKVLVDLHKTDGIIAVKNYRGEQKNECYQVVLSEHGISQAQFDSSIVWYSAKPKVFEKIYIDVMDEIQAENDLLAHLLQMEKALKNAQKPELAFLDSLTPKILTQTPDSQRLCLDILLGTYQEPERGPFPMRGIYQIQLQDSIFKALQDTTEQKTPAQKGKNIRSKPDRRGTVKKANTEATGAMKIMERKPL